jgi:hypothetical protein
MGKSVERKWLDGKFTNLQPFDICTGQTVFPYHTDKFSLVIRHWNVPDPVSVHEGGHINNGDVRGNADPRNSDIGNAGFHTLDEGRWFHAKCLERKTGLSVQFPAAGGNVPAGLGMVFKSRVRDHARDAICIRLPVTDNQNLIQDYSPP